MSTKYEIHPSIGIARVGNSKHDFYLAPESPGALPTQCDEWGNETLDKDGNGVPIESFKNGNSEVKRQAARFKIFVYDDVTSYFMASMNVRNVKRLMILFFFCRTQNY